MYHPYPFRKPTLCKKHDKIKYFPIQGQCESVSPCLKTFQNCRNSVNALFLNYPMALALSQIFHIICRNFWGAPDFKIYEL